ncbi:hypothetical protein [Mycolicibacterium goodii]|uniref:hypothetical protein n=1 Tax=Mycolicibacterium goodii TaxID=134601 RepID=UPI0018EAAEB0|nr:hypothetical protein [Mycolicibacterium goodii]
MRQDQRADEFDVGDTYASRHIVDIEKVDGGVVKHEVYLFGRRGADGRFIRVDEVTHMLEGTETDRAIGNAR